MIYLIGGPARCGKSTLADRVQKQINGSFIIGDAFVRALKENVPAHAIPDIFTAGSLATDAEHPEEKVDRLRNRDIAVWPFYRTYLGFERMSDDVLIEGNLWPDLIHELKQPHKAAFMIDTSPQQAERLIAIREEDESWMKGYDDETMRQWAIFNIARSQRYKQLCQTYGYKCFDIAEFSVQGAEDKAYEYLLY